MDSIPTPKKQTKLPGKPSVPWAWIGITVVVVSFFAMIAYIGTHRAPSTTDDTSSSSMEGPQSGLGGGGFGSTPTGQQCRASDGLCGAQGGAHPPVIGTVTAISATSITVKPSAGGDAQTFKITESTVELKGPNQPSSTFNPDNVKVGDTVGVGVSASDSTVAEVILPDYQTQTR